MSRFLIYLLSFELIAMTASWCAIADEQIVVPAVPVSVGPLLGWVLTVMGGMVSIFVPIIAIGLRTYFSVQNDQSRSNMINGSIVRAAHLADFSMTQQHLTVADVDDSSTIMRNAMNYVADSHPDAINATPEATDDHIRDAIRATLQQINTGKAATAAPSVVLSPVSAIR